jgi:8-oxo-dGTP diphosphatase
MVLVCAGAIILDPNGRIFLQRRAPDRRLFPDCWDIVGGHAEPGETPEQTLRREVHEETGWRVARILDRLPPIGWRGNDGYERVEQDFLVTVDGELTAPRLETDKHTAWQWVTDDRLDLLTDNRLADEDLVRWAEAVATGARRLVGTDFAGVVAAEIERVFPVTMRAMPGLGGRELAQRYGRAALGPLIEFRTSLAWPGRWVTAAQLAAVGRYRDPTDLAGALAEAARAGSVELDEHGAVRATDGRPGRRGRLAGDDPGLRAGAGRPGAAAAHPAGDHPVPPGGRARGRVAGGRAYRHRDGGPAPGPGTGRDRGGHEPAGEHPVRRAGTRRAGRPPRRSPRATGLTCVSVALASGGAAVG